MKDRIVGKVEEIKGRLTGDKAEELKGKARQKVGEGKQTVDTLLNRPEPEEPRRRDRELFDYESDETPGSS